MAFVKQWHKRQNACLFFGNNKQLHFFGICCFEIENCVQSVLQQKVLSWGIVKVTLFQ